MPRNNFTNEQDKIYLGVVSTHGISGFPFTEHTPYRREAASALHNLERAGLIEDAQASDHLRFRLTDAGRAALSDLTSQEDHMSYELSDRAQEEIKAIAREILDARTDDEAKEAARAMATVLAHYGVVATAD
jgi:intergrase/recombinase